MKNLNVDQEDPIGKDLALIDGKDTAKDIERRLSPIKIKITERPSHTFSQSAHSYHLAQVCRPFFFCIIVQHYINVGHVLGPQN